MIFKCQKRYCISWLSQIIIAILDAFDAGFFPPSRNSVVFPGKGLISLVSKYDLISEPILARDSV